MRSRKVKNLTILAMLSALGTVLLVLAGLMPTGQLGVTALAGLCGVAAICERGPGGGAAVYGITSLLGLLLAPDKLYVLLYAAFFGYYPLVKYLAEKPKSPVLSWGIKLAVFNAALFGLLAADALPLGENGLFSHSRIWLFPVLNAVFILFDLGVTQAIRVYLHRIHPVIHKENRM